METTPGPQLFNHTPEELKMKQNAMVMELSKTRGIVSKAAKLCGVTREIHEYWIKTDAEYRRNLHEIHERVLDEVEEMLFKQMEDGTIGAIIFFLRTQARKRGYIQNDRYSYPDGNTNYTAVFETPEEGDIWKNL